MLVIAPVVVCSLGPATRVAAASPPRSSHQRRPHRGGTGPVPHRDAVASRRLSRTSMLPDWYGSLAASAHGDEATGRQSHLRRDGVRRACGRRDPGVCPHALPTTRASVLGKLIWPA